jgi:hypothetical protein
VKYQGLLCCVFACGVVNGGCLSIAGVSNYYVDNSGAAAGSQATAGGDSSALGGGSDSGGPASEAGSAGSGVATCAIPDGQACGTTLQCGCPGSQNCVIASVSTDGKTMCTVSGVKHEDARCSSNEECAKGLMCRLGICRPFCADSADCDDANAVCEASSYVDSNSEIVDLPDVKVCKTRCDLADITTCPAQERCYLYENDPTTWLTQCVGAGSATGTNDCVKDTFACAPGYACANFGDCREYCIVGGTGCPSGMKCKPHSSPALVAGVEFGVCATDCDPLTASSCPSGEKCFPIGNAAELKPKTGFSDCIGAGAAAIGDTCASSLDCAAGLSCIDLSCEPLCRLGTASDCPSDSICRSLVAGFTVDGDEWGSCTKVCDPRAPAAVCGAGAGCFVYSDNSSAFTDCVKTGKGKAQSACSTSLDCAPGLACNGQGFCGGFCRIGQAADCALGTCTSYTDHPMIGSTEYGLCQNHCSLSQPAAACGAGNGCDYVSTAGEPNYSICTKAPATNPASCTLDTDCASGDFCSSGSCREWCRSGQNGDCSKGTCQAFPSAFSVDGIDYGFCG